MRISDNDRQRAIDELRRHCAAGRIDVDEYARRVEAVLDASTLEELDAVRADLPLIRIADPVASEAGWKASMPPSLAGPPSGLQRLGGGSGPITALGAAITAAVLVAALALGIAVSWAAALALVAGWLAGQVQARHRR